MAIVALPYPLLKDAPLKGRRVLVRAGFDVPIENGKVVDPSRIETLLPTMQAILQGGASLILMAHQGRPKDKPDPVFSQKPLVPVLETLLKTKVLFADSCTGDSAKKAAAALKPGEVLLLENLRFDPREKKNDPAFAQELASLGDLYVNDAFTNCHRAHASMVGVPKLLPSFMGLQLEEEITHLTKATEHPQKPVVLIISGAKMETKIPVIEHFLNKGDDVLIGGCVANTFIAARGFDVGESKYEEEWMEKCQELMLQSELAGKAKIHVPRDVVVASEATETATKLDLPVEDILGDMAIYDIGKVSIERFIAVIEKAKTIIWNGPLGLYELNRFSHATKRIAEAVAKACKGGATAILGGGDTIDFHTRYKYPIDAYTYVSTGGGAMLEFIGGKELPALSALSMVSRVEPRK
ncbi:phosphoglycerate kinase [Candidatus Peribacteria bacterium RIFCSPHIGHO2_01_FULL_55_13]|nr:MAG: phosphoglycerate kinase [Candidatus Peribacteria bacterium RIFCSPHIGHO2_01_FULL_55_13]OGJ65505.1 MAG: phosphoglycerate kinase [Candidatus Peribacteria bacterium RIFCSPHIGHO2_12_FULL_55_11]